MKSITLNTPDGQQEYYEILPNAFFPVDRCIACMMESKYKDWPEDDLREIQASFPEAFQYPCTGKGVFAWKHDEHGLRQYVRPCSTPLDSRKPSYGD